MHMRMHICACAYTYAHALYAERATRWCGDAHALLSLPAQLAIRTNAHKAHIQLIMYVNGKDQWTASKSSDAQPPMRTQPLKSRKKS